MHEIEANEIISRVQQNDLQIEEARVKQEREARRMLRIQAKNPGITSSELLNKLAGAEENVADPELKLPKETKENEPKNRPTGFPAPPKQAG